MPKSDEPLSKSQQVVVKSNVSGNTSQKLKILPGGQSPEHFPESLFSHIGIEKKNLDKIVVEV